MNVRTYDEQRDRDSVRRMWTETGWLASSDQEWMDPFLDATDAIVADVDGEAEALAATTPGRIRYLGDDLDFCHVAAVTTSHVARHRSLATRLTARAVANGVERYDAPVAGLGMFEQGFYDRLGFGTGGYDHFVRFHPNQLRVPRLERAPVRLDADDFEEMHVNRVERLRRHGGVSILPAGITRAETVADGQFGLGFRDESGVLTHHLWLRCKGNGEYGPYFVQWLAYDNWAQFVELLSVVRSLADQIRMVRIPEPPGVQLVDLLDRPLFHEGITGDSRYSSGITTFAWWQIRVCDVPRCVARMRSASDELEFNLVVDDPIERWLDEDAEWRGVGGEYRVSLGSESWAERGRDDALPTLRAGASAFSRLWLGVKPAPGLAATDELSADPKLLRRLDETIRMPPPRPDWDL